MNKRNHLLLQFSIVLLAWLFILGLQWQNNGLWFQGDSPRHAANGLFWKEFLLSGSLNPKEFALGYYARYPVISPTNYPPVFYILEGAVFAVSGPSPYIAKGLVLVFALLAASYLTGWLRRWISVKTGWAAALLLLTPGFVRWSNAVMLNVPATAISIAALYHARRWLEISDEPAARRHLYLAAVFSLAATLTHFVAGILVFIIIAWMLTLRQWKKLYGFRLVCVALIAVALFLPFFYVAHKWAPMHTSFVTNGLQRVTAASGWTFYLKELPELAGPCLVALALLGFVIGIAGRRWRQESFLLLVFMLVTYLALSVIVAKESRYGLLICVPIVCFCAMAVQSIVEWVSRFLRGGRLIAGAVAFTVGLIICSAQAWVAAKTPVARVQGIKEVVAFVERLAPNEPVFYDGFYSNVFTFYIQAGDREYKRRVVLGGKLLYASAMNPMFRYQTFVSSPEDIVQILQKRGGCRWLVIERSEQAGRIPASTLLRDTLLGPQFELVRSFPVSGPGLERIDVYRFRLDPEPINDANLPFPILGEGIQFKVRPIQR